MGFFLEDKIVRLPLQSKGMIQNKYMWQVVIPYVPFFGPGIDFTFLARSTSVPDFKREFTKVRTTAGTEFTVPHRADYASNEWPLTLYLPEFDTIYGALFAWSAFIDEFPTDSIKTTGILSLLSLNGLSVNKIFIFKGIYPLNIPAIDDLNFDSVSDLIEINTIFAFDNITYV